MQNNDLKKLTLATVALAALLSVNPAFADKASPVDLAKKELRSVPTAEMPAHAAKMISAAQPANAEATVDTVVTAALALKPAATVAVVGAIAGKNHELAPAAAAKAAALQPKSVAVIARAAASAAPSQAAQIAKAVCKVAPEKYAVIATAVAQVAPTATKEILAAVVEAVPALQPFVDRASTLAKDQSMGVIMAQTEALVKATAKSAKVTPETIVASATPTYLPPPPSVGPPFTPYSGNPTELHHSGTLEVPPGGGRNYYGP